MSDLPRLLLPPPFRAIEAPEGDLLALAAAQAHEGAGTLLWREAEGVLAIAVVLEPGPPLVSTAAEAELGYIAAVAALCEALVQHGQPERQIRVGFPDQIRYDGALIAGTRWQAGPLGGDGLPEWVIFAAEILSDRPGLEEPGLYPFTTSLEEEDFGETAAIIESFASWLKLIVDRWQYDGVNALLRRLLDRVEGDEALKGAEIVNGRLQLPPLALVLDEARWRDADRGGPKW
ncbi:biotin/lipoate--protein ligase family protein [Falsigemmobacter faecalis]|uniref:BPL/LPL catalytic domain-containing protein n=1 Tax=Falsigemmobacter faecalis TaxID=2488730 RepID=A0A3P3DWT3_9RHOB|nr:biotin/lipoate--protein ligase family protein [Falsigemmobacter faecalis]RRH78216.1 hypothetical protein EG244_01865 [Falsigemmobacter faecalis]